MNSTKNIKGNRQVLVATFSPPDMIFKLPDGLDLNDKTVVENYWVRYGTLYIKYVGNDIREEIKPYQDCEPDYKRPDDIKIEAAEDVGVEYTDDEEEEPSSQQ